MAVKEERVPPVIAKPMQPAKVRAIRPAPPAVEDGTRQLLRSGLWTLAAGLTAALLTKYAFGGIGREGPHTNSGWLALIVALMCLPFGSMLTLLGGAKWLRNRRLQHGRSSRQI